MSARKPLPTAIRRPSSTVAELLAAGASPSTLRSAGIARVSHGVIRTALLPQDFETAREKMLARCHELLPVLAPGQAFSHRTAAILFDMPIRPHPDARVDVAAIGHRRAPRRPEVIERSLRAGVAQIMDLHGLPVVSPADAWCLIASDVRLNDLVRAGDALVTGRRRGPSWHRHDPYVTMDELQEAVIRHHGGRGAALRRAALAQVREGVDSPAETDIRLIIVQAGFDEPDTDCPVMTALGLLHSDLGYPRQRVAIEHEGIHHFTGGAEQARRDVERWEAMHAAGWRVLRTTARDLRDPTQFLMRLRAALRERPPA